MKTKNLMVAGAVGALVAGTAAWAGSKSTMEVYIDTVSRVAYGSYANARGSADPVQHIGCIVQGHRDGTNTVTCSARDASFVSAFCTSSVPAIVTAAMAQSGDSSIYFGYAENGSCTFLTVSNSSQWAPRQP